MARKVPNPPILMWLALGVLALVLALPLPKNSASRTDQTTWLGRLVLERADSHSLGDSTSESDDDSASGDSTGSFDTLESTDAGLSESESDETSETSTGGPQSDESLIIATFNLEWALDDKRIGISEARHATSPAQWAEKVHAYAVVIHDLKADIIAVQEIGGDREISDIADELEVLSGHEYDTYVKESDFYQKTGLIWRRGFATHKESLQLVVEPKVLSLEFEWQGKPLTVVSLQFSQTKPNLAPSQADELGRAIEQSLDRNPDAIILVAGDTQSPSSNDQSAEIIKLMIGRGELAQRCWASTLMDGNKQKPTATTPDRFTDYFFACGTESPSKDVISRDPGEISDHQALALEVHIHD